MIIYLISLNNVYGMTIYLIRTSYQINCHAIMENVQTSAEVGKPSRRNTGSLVRRNTLCSWLDGGELISLFHRGLQPLPATIVVTINCMLVLDYVATRKIITCRSPQLHSYSKSLTEANFKLWLCPAMPHGRQTTRTSENNGKLWNRHPLSN